VRDAAIISALVVVASIATVDLLLSLALARRVRLLQQPEHRQAQHESLPSVGGVVEPFEATALDGSRINEGEFSQGSSLVAFLSAGCGPCERVKQEILDSPPEEPFLAFVFGTESGAMPGIAVDVARVAKVVWGEVNDEPVLRAFGIQAYPTVLRVVNGVVVSAGLGITDVA
jgi:hypothetical protein